MQIGDVVAILNAQETEIIGGDNRVPALNADDGQQPAEAVPIELAARFAEALASRRAARFAATIE